MGDGSGSTNDGGDTSGGGDHDAARRLREELMELAADGVASANRTAEALEALGIDETLVRGTGDLVYGAIVQQLLVGARIARRTHELGTNVARRTARRAAEAAPRLVSLELGAKCASERVEIRNTTERKGELRVPDSIVVGQKEVRLTFHAARTRLDPGQATSLLVRAKRETSKQPARPTGGAPRSYTATAEVCLAVGESDERLLRKLDIEVWILE